VTEKAPTPIEAGRYEDAERLSRFTGAHRLPRREQDIVEVHAEQPCGLARMRHRRIFYMRVPLSEMPLQGHGGETPMEPSSSSGDLCGPKDQLNLMGSLSGRGNPSVVEPAMLPQLRFSTLVSF
jgi:hypothetical protein